MTVFVVPLSIFFHQPAEVTDQEKETGDNHFLFSVRGHLWRGDLVPVLLCLHLLHHCLCLHPQQVLLFSARNWSAWWSFCFLIDSIAWKLLISPPPFSYSWAKGKVAWYRRLQNQHQLKEIWLFRYIELRSCDPLDREHRGVKKANPRSARQPLGKEEMKED